MKLLRAELRGFRNLKPIDWTPKHKNTVLYGANGSGKSSFLEALYYLSSLHSYRHAHKEELIQQGQDWARGQARLQIQELTKMYGFVLPKDKARKITVDDKEPKSLAQYYMQVPMVLFHPGDTALAGGPPEQRRHFMDRILEQIDPIYSAAHQSYMRALRSRNHLLRNQPHQTSAIEAYHEILASNGCVLGQSRRTLIETLAPVAEASFSAILGERVHLTVTYKPNVEPTAEALMRSFRESLSKDLVRKYTSKGPHADDVHVEMNQQPLRHYASQGQARATVFALKLAELRVLALAKSEEPILLLDDVTSELDRERNRNFFALLGPLAGQVILTTTHREYIELEEDRQDIHLDQGMFIPE